MSKGIIWLASFPKSGNTWVRAVWAAYLADGEPFDFRRMDAVTASESRWSEILAAAERHAASEMSDADVDNVREAVQKRLATTLPPTHIVKTHVARVGPHRNPLISGHATRAAIYVVRNPLDVVDSLSDHAGLTLDRTITLLNDPRHTLGRDDRMAPQYVGTWSEHVRSWTEHDDFPLLIVRYEDLHRDPLAHFTRVVGLLAGEVDQQRLARAIATASFEALTRLEERSAFPETSPLARSGRFFRRGRNQFWPNVLSRRQAAAIIEQHGEMMAKLGYELPDLRLVYEHG